jgi:hypothetical protein
LQQATIVSLPDDVLLEIFYIYLISVSDDKKWQWPYHWHKLVHVCRRWRGIIFASPLRLNLKLDCFPTTPVKKLLHIWPELPLALHYYNTLNPEDEDGLDNLIAALEHHDRVCQIDLSGLSSSASERITTMMQEPFPALEHLALGSYYDVWPVPDTFLNGSAPSLRSLGLARISIPSLPRLLQSASHLTSVSLYHIPNSGYISPESMATSLSALTNLKSLVIKFQSPTPHPRRRDIPLPPPIRIVLPALTTLTFQGVSEYLEVFASRVDAPLLSDIRIIFFNQLVLDIPQISRFNLHQVLSRPYNLYLGFDPNRDACIVFSWQQEGSPLKGHITLSILCKGFDGQVHSIAQMCTHIRPLCSSVSGLDIGRELADIIRPDDLDPTQWIELFNSFTSVQRLTIPGKLEPFVAAALQGLTEESAAKVLPALQNLSIVGTTTDTAAQQDIQSFVTARQHSDHPITLSRRSWR